LWAHALGNGRGDGLATDSEGNVILAGLCWGTSDFDPGAGTANVTSSGSSDIFIAKYAADGTFAWVRGIGGSGEEFSGGVAVDSQDNILFTGSFTGSFSTVIAGASTTVSATGSGMALTGKLNPSGLMQWVQTLNGTAANSFSRGLGIAVNAQDHAVMGGLFGTNAVLIDGSTYTATGFRDPLAVRYDTQGSVVWHMVMTCPNSGSVTLVTPGDNGMLALSGTYSGILTYAPGLTLPAHPASTASDAFLLMFTDEVIPVGLSSMDAASDVRIYPNPFSDRIMMAGDALGGEAVLRDMMGREVIRWSLSGQRTELDATGLAPGTYVLEHSHGRQLLLRQ